LPSPRRDFAGRRYTLPKETATDGLYLEEPPDIERYTLRFNHLVARALGPDESRSMIAALAERTT